MSITAPVDTFVDDVEPADDAVLDAASVLDVLGPPDELVFVVCEPVDALVVRAPPAAPCADVPPSSSERSS